MIYVFCDTVDLPALWVADRLRARRLGAEVFTASVLDSAMRWHHTVAANGLATVTIQLADGRRITSDDKAGVLNRLTQVPRGRLNLVGGEDKEYAAQEMSALFLSWLEALPGPLANRPTPQGLCGRWLHPSTWSLMAAEAGLQAAAYHQSHASDPDAAWIGTTSRSNGVTVFAVGDVIVASQEIAPEIMEGCRRLARATGDVLVGIELTPAAGQGWEVTGLSPRPDLTLGGEDLIDALARMLTVSSLPPFTSTS